MHGSGGFRKGDSVRKFWIATPTSGHVEVRTEYLDSSPSQTSGDQ